MTNKRFHRIKTVIAVGILFGLITTCRNENTPFLQIQGTHLTIEEVKSFIPVSIRNEKVLVYVNAAGQTKRMKAVYQESLIKQVHSNGERYTTDVLEADVYEIDNPSVRIAINGSANFSTDPVSNLTEVAKGLLYVLMPFEPDGVWAFLYFLHGAPAILPGEDHFHPTYVLLGRTFNNVYDYDIAKYSPPREQSAYSQLVINSEVGIVAFKDQSNDLWVFDHVE